MKRTLLLLALLSPLPACGGALPHPSPAAGPAAPTIQAVADGVTIRGTQALIIAGLVYQTVGTPIAVGMEQGVITGTLKARLQALDLVVRDALRVGRTARDAAEKARQSANALTAITEMARLAGIPLPQF